MNKLAFRRFVRFHAAYGKTKEARAACRELLANGGDMHAAYQDVTDMYSKQVGGPVQDFLLWLFDNREAILEFIIKIVSLFATYEVNSLNDQLTEAATS